MKKKIWEQEIPSNINPRLLESMRITEEERKPISGLDRKLQQALEENAGDAIIKDLKEKGANINARLDNGIGGTLVHLAASRGDISLLDGLIANNADVNNQNTINYETPLHFAQFVKDRDTAKEIVSKLLDAGAGLFCMNRNLDAITHFCKN